MYTSKGSVGSSRPPGYFSTGQTTLDVYLIWIHNLNIAQSSTGRDTHPSMQELRKLCRWSY